MRKRKKENTPTFKDKYTIGNVIGVGASSSVHLCTDRVTNNKFAVKILYVKNSVDLQRAEKEILILKQISHPNVIQLVDVFKESTNSRMHKFFIVTELVSGGDLLDHINPMQPMSEEKVQHIISKILEVLLFLHSHDIVHRDLKPENILIQPKKDSYHIKIADFGLSRLRDSQQNQFSTVCGTPGFVAPEVIIGKGYGFEVDLWATGVIAYILLCGQPPFAAKDRDELFRTIVKGDFQFPENCSLSLGAKDFIRGLLVTDPTKRMTCTQALKHPFLRHKSSGVHKRGVSDTRWTRAKKHCCINGKVPPWGDC
jgi:serine/threonine protein kinase